MTQKAKHEMNCRIRHRSYAAHVPNPEYREFTVHTYRYAKEKAELLIPIPEARASQAILSHMYFRTRGVCAA